MESLERHGASNIYNIPPYMACFGGTRMPFLVGARSLTGPGSACIALRL